MANSTCLEKLYNIRQQKNFPFFVSDNLKPNSGAELMPRFIIKNEDNEPR